MAKVKQDPISLTGLLPIRLYQQAFHTLTYHAICLIYQCYLFLLWVLRQRAKFLSGSVTLSGCQQACANWRGCESTCRRALNVADAMADPPQLATAGLLLNLARTCDRADEAVQLLRRVCRRSDLDDTVEARVLRITAMAHLGMQLDRLGMLGEARECYLKARQLAESNMRCSEAVAQMLFLGIGTNALNLGRLKEAEACYQILVEKPNPEENAIGPVMGALACANMGFLHLEAGRIQDAEASFKRALERIAQGYLFRRLLLAQTYLGQSICHSKRGDIEKAEKAVAKAQGIHQTDPGLKRTMDALCRQQRALICLAKGQLAKAVNRLQELTAPDCDVGLISLKIRGDYARALSMSGRREEAEAAFHEALRDYERLDTPGIPQHADCLEQYASALTSWSRSNEATEVRKRAEAMREAIAQQDVEPAFPLHWSDPSASATVGVGRRNLATACWVAGAFAIIFFWDVSHEEALYWTPGMPGVIAAVVAALVLAGGLLLAKRFTLRSLLVAVILTGLAGTVGQWRSAGTVQEVPFWFPIPEDRQDNVVLLMNEGLVGTLVRRGDLPESPVVIEVAPGQSAQNRGHLVIRLRPHGDRRVRGLAVAFCTYVQAETELAIWPTDDPDRQVHAEEAAATWYIAIRERFGREAANEVARASAQMVQDPDVQSALADIENRANQSWEHIQFKDHLAP